jgi:hypothetical protein
MNIFGLIYAILDLGVRLTLSTGALFNPQYQERTCAVADIASMKDYEPNYVVSEEWTPVFIKKEKLCLEE